MNTYQIFIKLYQSSNIKIGKLGTFYFPKGVYIYTGSAKRNINARIKRHLTKKKNLHWHIDYFLLNKKIKIFRTKKFFLNECVINKKTQGNIIVKGFGSSDCKNECYSHFKLIY